MGSAITDNKNKISNGGIVEDDDDETEVEASHNNVDVSNIVAKFGIKFRKST